MTNDKLDKAHQCEERTELFLDLEKILVNEMNLKKEVIRTRGKQDEAKCMNFELRFYRNQEGLRNRARLPEQTNDFSVKNNILQNVFVSTKRTRGY